MPLVPRYRVRIVDAAGDSHQFCCIRCAELWLNNHTAEARLVFVTDEVSAEEIEATAATYVRSLITTMPATGNRLHAFRDPADAGKHAAQWQGTILTPAERPFASVSYESMKKG
jgi:hypothetical protein